MIVRRLRTEVRRGAMIVTGKAINPASVKMFRIPMYSASDFYTEISKGESL